MKHIKDNISNTTSTISFKRKFTSDSLVEYCDLSPSCRKLFLQMLDTVGKGHTLEDLLVDTHLSLYDYKHRQNFSRDKNLLIAAGFLLSKNNQIVVNPGKIDYLTKSQRKALLILTGLRQDYVPDWTGKIPKPPKSSSN